MILNMHRFLFLFNNFKKPLKLLQNLFLEFEIQFVKIIHGKFTPCSRFIGNLNRKSKGDFYF